MKVDYCTTFNQKFFDLTGKNLLMSFLEHQPDNHMYVAYEEMEEEDFGDKLGELNNFTTTDISESEVLKSWVKENEDIIPILMGGKADPSICKCKNATKMKKFKGHIIGCPYSYFNSRAAGWFRKVVALNWAAEQTDAEILHWVDSDCVFKKHMGDQVINQLLGTHDVIYINGEQRRQAGTGVETGLIGFRRPFTFVKEWLDFFMSGKFKEELRWDDGYIFARMMLYDNHNARDLLAGQWVVKEIVRPSPYGQYIDHDKGVHHRNWALPDGYKELFDKMIHSRSK